MRGETASAEVVKAGFTPNGSVGHLLDIFIGNFPPLFHYGIAVFVSAFAAGIETSRTGIEQMNDTAVFFSLASKLVSGNSLCGFG